MYNFVENTPYASFLLDSDDEILIEEDNNWDEELPIGDLDGDEDPFDCTDDEWSWLM